MPPLEPQDLENLVRAVEQLESPGFFIKIINLAGRPVEGGFKKLPQKAQTVIAEATHKALTLALEIAIKTMDLGVRSPSSNILHKVMVGATGAAGGTFGLPALAVELPVSTGIMLRSIADVARSEGEDLRHIEARLQCVTVLGMGGRSSEDDASETAYFVARAAMAKAVSDAATYIAKNAAQSAMDESVPVLVRLLSRVAERFTPEVAEKVVAMGVPIIGALGGATINVFFIDHFQSVAHGHFTVRRLERKYGEEVIRTEYEQLAEELKRRR